ncbi:hypothetical protein ACFWN1_25355 [Streptomyces sp. NPDC058459]|uniref:hypothetical protein n=1 Tax=Streptomyces sp. NPDC058459 TaxID=3346508 RepID=UPI0036633EA4
MRPCSSPPARPTPPRTPATPPARRPPPPTSALGTALDSARVRRRCRDLAREAVAHLDIPHARQIHELLTTGRP